MIRVDGTMNPLPLPKLMAADLKQLLENILNDKQKQSLKENLQIDFAFEIPGIRCRANVFQQHRGLSAVFRLIPAQVPTFESLALPSIIREISQYDKGLVLITGATGSGKSTTLASMVNYINLHQSGHIITIEDPIEFIHISDKSIIHQREIGTHALSFQAALKATLREDPNVILIGELRDLESIRLALTAAETGHLVLATLHTQSAAKTIDRLGDVFPAEEKALVRTMLAESLRAVVSQTLVAIKGGGRVGAFEVMIVNAAIRNLIRENKVAQINSVIQTHQAQGMQTMAQSLEQLP